MGNELTGSQKVLKILRDGSWLFITALYTGRPRQGAQLPISSRVQPLNRWRWDGIINALANTAVSHWPSPFITCCTGRRTHQMEDENMAYFYPGCAHWSEGPSPAPSSPGSGVAVWIIHHYLKYLIVCVTYIYMWWNSSAEIPICTFLKSSIFLRLGEMEKGSLF